jgi:hypothetical protein
VGSGLPRDWRAAFRNSHVVPTCCFVNAISMVPSHVLGTMWSKGNSVGLPFVVWWPYWGKGVGVFFLRDGKILEWYDYTISMERA